ncbi:MAG: NFACT RNA binding domain-containing protein [Candidatus Micrarchaeia archaeon]
MPTVEIDLRKTLQENANSFYQESKRLRAKASRIEEMLKKGISIKKAKGVTMEEKAEKKKWYEHFRWFISSEGFIVIAGKNANQNETIYKRVMNDNDIFMHAEIIGAPFTVIKNGTRAKDKTLNEAAQFAASYSRAWKFGYASIDVYSVKKEQLTKKTSGEYVKKGGVIVIGERVWYRNVPLGLAVGFYGEKLACFPEQCANLLKNPIKIVPGRKTKEEIADVITSRLNCNRENVIALLPAGNFEIA